MGQLIQKCSVCLLAVLLALSFLIQIPQAAYASTDYFELSLDELMNLQVTTIATKTPLSLDAVPGTITVLYGDDLRKKGIRYAFMALREVAGMQYDEGMFIVRGIGYVGFSGKVLFLLNGIPTNTALSMAVGPFNLPIELVDRIEIIRGPGSALYGKEAYMAVVNFITRTEGSEVTVRGGERLREVSFSTAYHSEDKSKGIILSGAYNRVESSKVFIESDSLRQAGNSASRAPGYLNDSSAIPAHLHLNAFNENARIEFMYNRKLDGSYMGFGTSLPPYEDRYTLENEIYLLQGSYTFHLSGGSSLRLKLGGKQYQYDRDDLYLYPPGYTPPFPGAPTYTNGLIAGPHYRERTVFGGLELSLPADNHDILVGIEAEHNRSINHWQDDNYDPVTYSPQAGIVRYRGDKSWLADNMQRNILSVFAQDRVTLSAKTSLVGSARYDAYNDIGGAFSPRIALVHRLSERHLIKAQYAEAFRPPSFIEMYFRNNPLSKGNPSLESETVSTAEVTWQYQHPRVLMNLTLFEARLKKLIDLNTASTPQYINRTTVRATGLEVDVTATLHAKLQLQEALSYIDTEYLTANAPLIGSADINARTTLLYNPTAPLTIALAHQYRGEQHRATTDSRPPTPSLSRFNLCVTYEGFLREQLTIAFAVDNLTDENEVSYSTIPKDWPLPGRTWWMKASWEFDN